MPYTTASMSVSIQNIFSAFQDSISTASVGFAMSMLAVLQMAWHGPSFCVNFSMRRKATDHQQAVFQAQ